MKTVASLKANNTSSPKTPGGISKSLLTPCRRLGLSRNWKRSGPSPFISPLASSDSATQSQNESEPRKKKEKDLKKKCESSVSSNIDLPTSELEVDTTPSRHIELSRKRKSKTLISNLSEEETNTEPQNVSSSIEDENLPINVSSQNKQQENILDASPLTEISTPVRQKSKSKIKHNIKQTVSSQKTEPIKEICDAKVCDAVTEECKDNTDTNITYSIKEKSPNELKKECVVVIQRKIFKNDSINTSNEKNTLGEEKQANVVSQTLFDSDSDDLPLCQMNQNESKKEIKPIKTPEDDDFVEHKTKIRKLDKKSSSPTTKEKQKPDKKMEKTKKNHDNTKIKREKPESFDDDEDFDFDNKKTILIRKTYEKTAKPLKAKSTGSITQRDIDELKARIEVKKKVLLAKTLTEDTKELRELIKKWQKGCQEALMELMDLMKKKFPEKSNMDYSEILQSLHIPAALVGYDSENDCFCTPDDTSIVLGQVNNL